ncbi:hypothetical protein BOVATA_041890 [Babesia ovata]|uniref:ELMO domain-containing protein n=1 Tax=Babesia ovata TaxID=189622 RepID=A0A2H6KI82_9APIC|nr:uncharacterized protein BOVATA_041890 [Babesia ovata]GBE62696.1 hypothetical protein BOVATA_041890 [Babesia ovata]
MTLVCLLFSIPGNSHPMTLLLNSALFKHTICHVVSLYGPEFGMCNPEAVVAFEDQYGELLVSMTGCRDHLTDALSQILKKNRDVSEMVSLAAIKVDQKNEEHCRLLHESWAALDDRPVPESFDVTKSVGKGDDNLSSWGDLGFQTPLTDFRMTGVLGLQSLHFVVTRYKKRSRETLQVSRSLQAWFPFALTSINVTAFPSNSGGKLSKKQLP